MKGAHTFALFTDTAKREVKIMDEKNLFYCGLCGNGFTGADGQYCPVCGQLVYEAFLTLEKRKKKEKDSLE